MTSVLPANTPSETSSVPGAFGRYRLLYQFAAGGMASVYLAQFSGSDGFSKLVAIKLIHPHLAQDTSFIHMFIDEARLASRITHPNVAQVLELGCHDGRHFMVMEYVHGECLTELIRHAEVPLPICCRIISQAAAGLHAAHELHAEDGALIGVVHRDISPSNIMVSYEGAVKVIDFGVAKARGSLHVSTGKEMKGKFAYMAPEQLNGSGVTRQTDIFALGIVLFECSTRKRLFRGDTDSDAVGRVLSMPIPAPSSQVASYPPALEAIVLRALERDPARRFSSAEELHEELERYIVSTGEAVVPGDLARLMQATFAGRIVEKRSFQRQKIGTDTPTVTSPTVPSVSGLHRPRRGRWALLAGLALLGVSAAIVLPLSVGKRRADRPPIGEPVPKAVLKVAPPASRPATTDEVEISIIVLPASARLTVDGAAVENPCKLRIKRRDVVVWADASAAGYRPERIPVSLARSVEHRLHLQRKDPAKARPAKTSRHDAGAARLKVPTKKPLFENPYE